jgi:hypothetical protein
MYWIETLTGLDLDGRSGLVELALAAIIVLVVAASCLVAAKRAKRL